METLGAKFLTDQWQQLIRPLTVEETQAFNGVAVNGKPTQPTSCKMAVANEWKLLHKGKADPDAFVRLATSAVSSLREWLLLYFVVTTKPDSELPTDCSNPTETMITLSQFCREWSNRPCLCLRI